MTPSKTLCRCHKVMLLIVAFLNLIISAHSETTNGREMRHKPPAMYNNTVSPARESCVRAERPVTRALRRERCHRYSARAQKARGINITPHVCQPIVGNDMLYAAPLEQEKKENLFVTYIIRLSENSGQTPHLPEHPIQLISNFCRQLIIHMYCRFLLPKCDLTSSFPRPQPLCKEACRAFTDRCQSEWSQVQREYKSVTWKAQRFVTHNSSCLDTRYSLMCCKDLPGRNGSDIPECYYPEMLKDTKSAPVPITDTCFIGDGQSYRGNVSLTRSGYTCQSQCPHRHHRIPNNTAELKNAGNTCRNPGGQAPDGPWCYTTNRTVRWEYCRVEKCEAQEED